MSVQSHVTPGGYRSHRAVDYLKPFTGPRFGRRKLFIPVTATAVKNRRHTTGVERLTFGRSKFLTTEVGFELEHRNNDQEPRSFFLTAPLKNNNKTCEIEMNYPRHPRL